MSKKGYTQKEIAKIMKCSVSNISAILNYKSWV